MQDEIRIIGLERFTMWKVREKRAKMRQSYNIFFVNQLSIVSTKDAGVSVAELAEAFGSN